jgi:hypothetical protein
VTGPRRAAAAGLAAAALGVAVPPAAAAEPLLCAYVDRREVLHITVRPFEVCVLVPAGG